jgi:CHAT domain-containing protein
MVTMANTPGAGDLPGVKAERSTVLAALGTTVQVEALDQPDSASVMLQIQECNIALLLQTTSPHPEQDILSVLKLCENHPTLGEIAYLSACSTAENRVEELVDEVLHVVSGFQVAGFRHVIGTLWPSDDSVCVEVARSFYTELCRNGALDYSGRAVAMALHKAVSDVSKSVDYRNRPLHWAQYVHYGA